MVIPMRRLLYALVALVLGSAAALLAAPGLASAGTYGTAASRVAAANPINTSEDCPGTRIPGTTTVNDAIHPGATIMSSTTTPFVGQHIEASGIQYCPNEDVRLTIGGHFVGTAHTNSGQSFDPQVVVPAPVGDQLLCGVGASGLSSDQDCLTLHVVSPTAPNSGPPLSFTGVEIGAMVAVAIALLVGGALFATVGRRRKSHV
ncbi:MAG TPA: hypothetical protein VGH01_09160 [Jatrophihabitantaceae bacterium]